MTLKIKPRLRISIKQINGHLDKEERRIRKKITADKHKKDFDSTRSPPWACLVAIPLYRTSVHVHRHRHRIRAHQASFDRIAIHTELLPLSLHDGHVDIVYNDGTRHRRGGGLIEWPPPLRLCICAQYIQDCFDCDVLDKIIFTMLYFIDIVIVKILIAFIL